MVREMSDLLTGKQDCWDHIFGEIGGRNNFSQVSRAAMIPNTI
jgi:hypothetical protein